jgi:glycerophosphoryl diester phosphodiesterase
VLAHDKDLKRVWNLDRGIWEISYEELRQLDSGSWFDPAFSDQRVQTLAQVIQAVRGRVRLNIEMKFHRHEQALPERVAAILREQNFVDQCIVTSLDYAGLRRAATALPELRTGLIVTSSLGDITRLECDVLSVSSGAVTRGLLDRARRRGLEVHVWTVNEIAEMNSMIGMGVDQVITDDPRLLAAVIERRAAMDPSEKALLRLAEILDHWL